MAKAKGYFAKYGIEPRITNYSFGIDTLNALVTNQEQFGMAMDYAAISRLGKGGFKLVAVSAVRSPENDMLF